ncbi:MAG: hypothetical protein JWP03_1277 [Phycisphaerales bacterium]|nr:hypothetical protein [Phycisphaerales bacterium]
MPGMLRRLAKSLFAAHANCPVAGTAAILFCIAFVAERFVQPDTTLDNALIFAAILMILFWFPTALRAEKDAKRQSKGLCRACGYDLRATPERRPECGTIRAALKGNE